MSLMVLNAASSTDLGRRQVNQDRVFVDQSAGMFVVADGMGGHRGGATAAEMAVAAISTSLIHDSDSLARAVETANRDIFDRSSTDPDLRGMGTTITAIALVNVDGEERLSIANVGDSRAYRLRAGELELLTEDHNIVSELVRGGQLSAVDARNHRQRSVLTRAVGVEPTVAVDVVEVLASSGDRFLLCSDGLTGDVEPSQIAGILRRYADPAEACRDLIRVALEAGSKDNISAIVVDVLSDGRTPTTGEASGDLRSRAADTPRVDVDETLVLAPRVAGRTPAAAAESGAPLPQEPVKSRRLITGRTIAFIAALAAIAGVVFWAISNAPQDGPVPTGSVTPPLATTTPPTTIDQFTTTRAPGSPAPIGGPSSTAATVSTARPTLALPSTAAGAPTTGLFVTTVAAPPTIPVSGAGSTRRSATSRPATSSLIRSLTSPATQQP